MIDDLQPLVEKLIDIVESKNPTRELLEQWKAALRRFDEPEANRLIREICKHVK